MASAATTELFGWLFDVYADPRDGAVVWFIGEDGQRHRFTQQFPVDFYLAGERDQLRAAWRWLQRNAPGIRLARRSRRELYDGDIEVLAVRVFNPAQQPRLFRRLFRAFPELTYYDADIALPIRYHAAYGLFPLAYSKVKVDSQGRIMEIESLDSHWEIEPRMPPLRELSLKPSESPGTRLPTLVRAGFAGQQVEISTANPKHLLQRIDRIIREYDPDVIFTRFGDRWLFPHLLAIAQEHGISFNPNRDQRKQPISVKENTFTSYGRIMHRDRQTLLSGRAHIDSQNSMAHDDIGLDGVYEFARLTGLPLQNAARRSAGGGFTAMQVRAALQQGILVPINKKRSERYKSAEELITSDRGGVVYQPLLGLHRDVAEIDFFSMYPSIMDRWNISPETVGRAGGATKLSPAIGRPVAQDARGIVSDILNPVLAKRALSKQLQKQYAADSAYGRHLATVTETLKWFGWVSYGYQGFSGNRIGSIEAHEVINDVSRELILRAKEVAEEQGFEVLHMYVDSLFVRKAGVTDPDVYGTLIAEMEDRTEIKLKLEGIFRWLVFLPSKQNEKVPVPNSYYGVFQDGAHKYRGIMLRRGDTPEYIKTVQKQAITMLGKERDFERLPLHLPRLVRYFQGEHKKLSDNQVPPGQLTIRQRLSRDPEQFKVLSPAGRAARQLVAAGRRPSAGQTVEYLRVIGDSDVLAWELAGDEEPLHLDNEWYCESLLRAAHEILQPYGVDHSVLAQWLSAGSSYFRPEDYQAALKKDLPLFEQSGKSGRP
jgi:DNA polymerase-2